MPTLESVILGFAAARLDMYDVELEIGMFRDSDIRSQLWTELEIYIERYGEWEGYYGN